jgi:hypothetical protein
MDGYAVRAADVRDAGVVLQVTQRIARRRSGACAGAGHGGADFHRRAGAARADAVVMQEDTEAVNGDFHACALASRAPGPASGFGAPARTSPAAPWCCLRAAPVARQPGAGGQHRLRPLDGGAAARAWRCSPPGMNW